MIDSEKALTDMPPKELETKKEIPMTKNEDLKAIYSKEKKSI